MESRTVGILGGGQLGSMLIRHAIDMGIKVSIMDKSTDAPASNYTASFQAGSLLNEQDVLGFGEEHDVVTIEIEAVNTDALAQLAANGKEVYPAANIIKTIQDKYHQKQFLQSHGIPVAHGVAVHGAEEIKNNITGYPMCLKTRTSGYDGNGVMLIKSEADIAKAFTAPSLLEECVAIDSEISVIVARNKHGEVVTYDPTLMVFDPNNFVLDHQMCPSGLSTDITTKARELAVKVATSIDLVGILAVEMFLTKDGEIIVNELAPRPHNSGHHTIEACTTSQYEQHLRAILGMPLGSTKIFTNTVLINILGPHPENADKLQHALNETYKMAGAHVHWYGKTEIRKGRKLGHIVVTADTMDEAKATANNIRQLLKID